MKNIIRIFTFMLAISIIFTACNKDTSLTEVEKNIDPTEQKILDFKAKMQNPNKSGETMSIDSAVWYIEAALNYTHCDTASSVIGIDSAFVSVNVSDDGSINFNDVVVAYNQMNDKLTIIVGENSMRLADIEFVNNSDKSGQEELKLTVVETKAIPLPNQYYTITDNWYAGPWNGVPSGNCSGSVTTRDLTDEVEKWVTYKRAVLANVYYTDVYFDGWFFSYAPWEDDMYLGDPGQNIYSAG